MARLRREQDPAEQAFRTTCARPLGSQHLQRHPAPVLAVFGRIHDGRVAKLPPEGASRGR